MWERFLTRHSASTAEMGKLPSKPEYVWNRDLSAALPLSFCKLGMNCPLPHIIARVFAVLTMFHVQKSFLHNMKYGVESWRQTLFKWWKPQCLHENMRKNLNLPEYWQFEIASVCCNTALGLYATLSLSCKYRSTQLTFLLFIPPATVSRAKWSINASSN